MQRERRGRILAWSCCYCGHGCMNVYTTPACVNCGVARCSNCYTYDLASEVGQSEAIRVRTSLRNIMERRGRTKERISALTEKLERRRAIPRQTVESQHRGTVSQDGGLMRDLLEMKVTPNHLGGRTEGIVDTGASETETIVSTISSVTTLVDPGAVEDFAFNIMKFQSLGCLWPQLVGRYSTERRCIHVIERLLKRYSEDLALEGQKIKASQMSGGQLYLTAARFVRKSRIEVAHKIWEAQFQNMDNSAVKNAVESLSDTEVPDPEVDEDDNLNVPADDDLPFESIEEILFDKSPVFSLQANIKLLVNLSNPTDNSIVYRLSTSFHTFMGNTISSLYEPSLPPGYTRLRYTCVSLTYLLFICFHISPALRDNYCHYRLRPR